MVSIIIPVYNAEKYLHRCVDSILHQTYKNFELILVDDGSKDCSPQICDEYALKDNRVKVIHQNNSGVSAARNAGLDFCSGQFIAFVDADDYIGPKMIHKMMSGFQCGADIVISGFVRCHEKQEKAVFVNAPEEFDLQNLKENYDTYKISNSAWAKLYRRDLLGDIRFNDKVSMGEDLLFNLQYYNNCRNFACVQEADYYYDCTNQNSAMHNFKSEYIACQKLLYSELKKFKYGKVVFTNDMVDKATLSTFIDYLQCISVQKLPRREKKDYKKEIYNDELFITICKGKYNFSLQKKLAQFLCRHKLYCILRMFFALKKILSVFKR